MGLQAPGLSCCSSARPVFEISDSFAHGSCGVLQESSSALPFLVCVPNPVWRLHGGVLLPGASRVLVFCGFGS